MNQKIQLHITLLISFLMISNNAIMADTSHANDERSLVEIFDDFAVAYNVFFSYQKSMIEDVKVDFDLLEDERLSDAMDRLLSSLDLDYEIIGERYIVVFQRSVKSVSDLTKLRHHFKEIEKIESEGNLKLFNRPTEVLSSSSEQLSQLVKEPEPAEIINGAVKDEDGEGLIGASVRVVGTGIGTTTDLDGNFSLSVEELPVTLEISYTGYNTQSVLVSDNSSSINVELVSGLSLEEVVVTSRKREESLKDVPVAITAVSGRKLEALQAEDLSSVAAIAPNVNFSFAGTTSGSPSAAVVYIRGVGQNDFLQTLDPGVGIYVDGVYMGRTVGGVLDLVDPARVEVLRGPQGSLFGRNTIGGAISLTSKDPGDETEGFIKATTGDFSRLGLQGSLNVPFSNTLKARFSAKYHRRDGYVERLIAGDDLGNDNSFGGRANFLYEPSDKFSLRFNFDYTLENERGAAEEELDPNGVFATLYNNNIVGDTLCPQSGNPACFQNTVSTEEFTTNETAPNFSEVNLFGTALIGEYDINDILSLKSITSFRDLKSSFTRGSDGSPVVLFQTQNEYDQSQFSQELQLTGSSDAVDFVTGLYFFNETGSALANVEASALPFIPTFPLLSGGEIDNSSFALFGEATFNLTERFHLTGGLRFTTETKRFNPNSFAENHPTPRFITEGFRELDFSRVTWRGIAAYDVSDNTNVYGSVSTGFKSGGFDSRYTSPTVDNEPTTFDPENVTNFEIGLKTFIPAADLRLNIAAFIADYENIQVQGNPPGQIATVTFNGAEASINGLELELDWSPINNFIVSGSLGLLDASYESLDANTNEFTLEDNLIRTPTSSYNIGVSYLFGIGEAGSLLPRVDITSQNNIHFEPANNDFVFEDGYNNVNASITYTSKSRKINIVAGIINLTDSRYLVAGDSNGTLSYANGIFARPRNWFTSVKYNF